MRRWKATCLSAGFVLLGLAVLIFATGSTSLVWRWLGLALGGAMASAGTIASISVHLSANRTVAAMRLDWFVPFLRKKRKNALLAPMSWPSRWGRRMLPGWWFADRVTGKPGLLRRWLRWIGPTMLSSPLRRLVQAGCLVLFLILFFYVCWPYTARPADDPVESPGWRFVEIDAGSGELIFQCDSADPIGFSFDPLLPLHLVDTTAQETQDGYLGQFGWHRDRRQIWLTARGEFTAEQLDALLVGTGPWSFFNRAPDAWPSHYADDLSQKERYIAAEIFLIIDPLVSLSTAIASRSWVWSLASAGVILIVCVMIPRGFCGYLCPLGTVIDLFDWAIAGRVVRLRVPGEGWWVHIKYYLLSAVLVSAVGGVLVSGYVSAIPVLTRGLLFVGEPLQTGLLRDWHQVPPLHTGHFVSIGLFFAVLSLGFLRPRFWCRYVCPSGAVFSLGNLFRATERKVESTCINCNKCVEICPFDAIKPDFTTRVTDCTMCQTCGGVCPTHAIKFVERWNTAELKVLNDPPTGETAIGRRGFLSLAAGSAAAIAGGAAMAAASRASAAATGDPDAFVAVRPPGSVPESEFLQLCIRCGECFKACPNNVLQAEGFQQGLQGLWTPLVNADWAGCESSCNACGQVCPTGAIRPLPLEEKKVARMGLAIVNEATCLPFANRDACQLCVDECQAAGYDAIEFLQVHTRIDDQGQPVEGSGYLAPVVLPDRCVGCGLCQTRCYAINVKEKHLLDQSAIIIHAGEDREDRIRDGSYVDLRATERSHVGSGEGRPRGERLVPTPPDVAPPAGDAPSDDPFGVDGGDF